MFTIFFLGPDFIIANIRNNNVTHNEPVSSREQPSSLQTGTTKAQFILLRVMLILHIPIKNNDLHDKEPPNEEKGWNIYEAYKTGTHCSHMNNGSSFGAQLLLTVDTLSPTPDTSIQNPSAVTPTSSSHKAQLLTSLKM
jgi:hypothetical protein